MFILIQFSKRNDIFKVKSDEAKFQISLALQNLKKNQLLTTAQFKKLQKTQNLIKNKHPNQSSIIKNQRYQYKRTSKKYSQSNLIAKKQKSFQNSKNTSSISSTLIQNSNNDQINQYNIDDQQLNKKLSSLHQTIEKNINQHVKYRKNIKNSLQIPIFKSENKRDFEIVQIMQMNEGTYQNGKAGSETNNQKKKRNKNIKSQKFIPRQLVFKNQEQIENQKMQTKLKTCEDENTNEQIII